MCHADLSISIRVHTLGTNTFFRPRVFTSVSVMPTFTIPAVNIHITAGPQHVELCTGSACCVGSFPSTSKNIAILTVGSDNKFSLARSTVDLDGTPTSQASKLDPGMAFRFTAPGQSPADPVGLVQQNTASEQHGSLQQHVCTQYVSLQSMLHARGRTVTKPQTSSSDIIMMILLLVI